MAERLFLIDGTALAYQQHFAMVRAPLTNSRGQITSAVYGFANRLLSLLEDEKPDHLAVAFDGPDPTFRHERFEEYKATREKMPDDLVNQLAWIQELVEAMHIPFIISPRYEADDVIGTLARWAEERDVLAYLVTSDKDFFQLVNDRVHIIDPRKDWREMGPPEVEEKFGVPPGQVCDVLALMGDSSDNIPGVPGIGPKGAVKLVKEHGTLEAVLDAAEGMKKSKMRQNLIDFREQARLSLELVRIHTDVPMEIEWGDLSVGEPDRERLAALFSECEFETLTKRFTSAQETDEHSYQRVRTAAELDRLLGELREAEEIVFDLETTGLDPFRAEIVGFAFSAAERTAHYVPCNDDALLAEVGGRDGLLDRLRPILADAAVRKGGQNVKYDLQVLETAGVEVQGLAFDTMVSSFLVDSSLRQHNLDSIALRYLDFKKIPTGDLIGKGKDQVTMLEVPIDDVARYACEDADITYRMHALFRPRIAEMGLDRLYREVEVPLVGVLTRMERAGIGLDLQRLETLSKELEGRIAAAEREVFEIAGEEFNVSSTQQLGKVLFEKMQIQNRPGAPRVRKTKTGYSTAAPALEPFVDEPIVEQILEYRTLSKLKSTYLDALPRYVHPDTGRIHTSFHQTGAATGRLSSSDPNLQNIPIRSEAGREIRAAFIPGEKGCILLSADYSQIELRVLAHLAGDPGLKEAFAAGEDVHRRTAATLAGVAPDEVTPRDRDRAKVVNYGIIYGMGPQRLARETGVSLAEAKRFIDAYFDSFPRIRDYLEEQKRRAREDGYVTTYLGRRRAFPDILSTNRAVQQNAERAAVNTPIQGSAADIIKLAMIEIDGEIRQRSLASRMLLQVHDELVFRAPESEVDELRELVRQRMEGCVELEVPLVVQIGEGGNWLEAH